MRTQLIRAVTLAAAALLALGACSDNDPVVGGPGQTGPGQTETDEPGGGSPSGGPREIVEVGEAIAYWSQSDGSEAVPDVEAILTTSEGLDEWLDSLPADTGMRESFEVVDTDVEANVYAVMQYPECGNTVYPVTDGTGAIAEEEVVVEDIACEWAPERVIMFEIPRADLGDVEDADIRRDDTMIELTGDGPDDPGGDGTGSGGSGHTDGPGGSTSLSDVGDQVAGWVQDAGTDVSGVDRHGLATSQEELDQWLAAQPADLGIAEALDARVDLTNSVAVILSLEACGNTVVPVTDGTGAVAGDLRNLEPIECTWAPLTLVLYEIGLDELGIDDPADARIDPSLLP
ncbi:MAG: hypothetical protein ACTHW7_01330 [Actinomycetaceae bacterium]